MYWVRSSCSLRIKVHKYRYNYSRSFDFLKFLTSFKKILRKNVCWMIHILIGWAREKKKWFKIYSKRRKSNQWAGKCIAANALRTLDLRTLRTMGPCPTVCNTCNLAQPALQMDSLWSPVLAFFRGQRLLSQKSSLLCFMTQLQRTSDVVLMILLFSQLEPETVEWMFFMNIL